MKKVQLTMEQSIAKRAILDWLNNGTATKPFLTMGGYAGTGKSTVIREIVAEAKRVTAVAALAGKAASVLRQKGLKSAQTMHSLMYTPVVSEETYHDKKTGEVKTKRVIDWVKVDTLGVSYNRAGQEVGTPVEFAVVDEGSMVSTPLHEDLQSFGVPVLYVGDHGQLEPIGKNPGLMKHPDLTLTTIHRQAENCPVIGASIMARKGLTPHLWKPSGNDGSFKLGRTRKQLEAAVLDYEQVICGYHRTRKRINAMVRKAKGYDKAVLLEGEKLVCKANDRKAQVFNGMLADVLEVKDSRMPGTIRVVLRDPLGEIIETDIDTAVLREQEEFRFEDRKWGRTYWNYGYCLTCHSAQGSEWDSVAVIHEVASIWNPKRWMYTAVTRAAKDLFYYMP